MRLVEFIKESIMYERRLCTSGHLTTFTHDEGRSDIIYWTCPICSNKYAWHEFCEADEGCTVLEPSGGFVEVPTYKIPLAFTAGNWYKTTDAPYKCISLAGMHHYPVILQTLSGYTDCCDLRGLNPHSFKYKPCSEPHNCKHNMIVTTAGTDIQKGKAVIQVMAHCTCGKIWKGTTHIKEIK